MKRRTFLQGCGALAGALAVGRPALSQPLDPISASVAGLRRALDQGTLTASDLLQTFLARIQELDPKIHAIIELNPQAKALAESWDRNPFGVLGGIPVLLKDNIATADQTATAAGSAALKESRYPFDSGVASRLREAGAIILGKANMSEWANFRSDNSTSGWSGRGGQCKNPHVLDRSPCGSSSGSAAAVAAGFAPLAVGTETVGSIVCPSATCGIVGIKPTPGLVPESHIIPIATSWDTAGPMARSVADATFLLEVLAGRSYQASLRTGSLQGARIGVARSYFGFDARVDRLMEQEIERLKALGATIVDPVAVPTWRDVGVFAEEVMLYEFKAGVNEYLAGQTADVTVRSLSDVIAFNEANPGLEKLHHLGQEVLIKAELKAGLDEPSYREALRQTKARVALEPVFDEHRLDAIVGPTNGPAWTIDLVNGDHFEGGSAVAAAIGGYPSLTVPAGFILDLPIGLSMFGPKHSEERLISLAYDYEQATEHIRAPRFLPSL